MVQKQSISLTISLLLAFGQFAWSQEGAEAYHPFLSRVLYSGIENHVLLQAKAEKKIKEVATDNGFCYIENKNTIVIIPETPEGCNLILMYETKKSDTIKFSVWPIPDPILILSAGVRHSPIKKVSEATMLLAIQPSFFPFDIRMDVLSFEVIIFDRDNKFLAKVENLGFHLNPLTLRILDKYQEKWGMIIFRKVKIRMPNNSIRLVSPLIISPP